jgi:hypothetical protein
MQNMEIEPFIDPLSSWPDDQRRVAMDLISVIFGDHRPHRIREQREDKGGGIPLVAYWIAFEDGTKPARPMPIRVNTYILDALQRAGMVRYVAAETGEFTPLAMAWYQNANAPTDRQVQQEIARELMKTARGKPYTLKYEQTDLAPIADNLDVPIDRVLANAHTLIHIGKAQGGQTLGATVEKGYISLTASGIDWVNDDFSDHHVTNVQVSVGLSLELTIHTFIEQIQELKIPDDLKELINARLQDFEADPTFSKFQKIISFVSDSATVGTNAAMIGPFLINFLVNSADQLHKLFNLPSFLLR